MPLQHKAYMNNPRGHLWKRDKEGEIEWCESMADPYHQGPQCEVCRQKWCISCFEDGPNKDCLGYDPFTLIGIIRQLFAKVFPGTTE